MANLLHALKALTPLGHDAPEILHIGPLSISENTGVAMASLAARNGCSAEVARLAAAQGIPLPAPGRAEQGALYAAFWLGPDHWMIEAPDASHEDITAILKPLFGEAASITEQTDAWVRFDLAAADLPKLVERLCNFDLQRNGPGSASRTVIDHLGCYLLHRARDAVTVIGPRSSAQALHHALITAAQSAF